MLVDTIRPDAATRLHEAVAVARGTGAAVLPEAQAKQVLRSWGIAVPQGCVAATPEDVPAELGDHLVVKAVSPTLVHKSDAGGVRLGVRRDELAATFAEMTAAVRRNGHAVDAFLVETQADPGQELVVGATRVPGVGWVVMVGLGGIFVEVLEDVAFGVAPLDSLQVAAMLDELRGIPLLRGARNSAPVDEAAFVELIVQLAGASGLLATLPPEITEIDLNPVIVSATGAVAADARFVVDPVFSDEPATRPALPAVDEFSSLFAPQTVAVLGASATGRNGANGFLRSMLDYGFPGRLVPVHPKATHIEGLPAVASLAEVEGSVDYAYVALPAAAVADALDRAGGRVRFAQVISSGFAETAEGIELERDLVTRMRGLGTRIIGPNCLGTFAPAGRLTFVPDSPHTQGGVAVVSQSGGLSVDILRLGTTRGLAFHSITSIGNQGDVTAGELLQYLLADRSVTTIGLYLESLAAGREMLEVLTRAGASKPVVLLAGGRSSGGARAATSHTGALTGNHRLWPALARQAGVALVESLPNLLDVLLTFDTVELDALPGTFGAVLFGNGGGASVLAVDALERVGIRTPMLPPDLVDGLDSLDLPPGNGLHNPIDVPAGTLAVRRGAVAADILGPVLAHVRPSVVICHLNVGIIQRNLGALHGDVTGTIIDAVAAARDRAPTHVHHLLVLKADGKPDTEAQLADYRARARARGIPHFATMEDCAVAAGALVRYAARSADSVSGEM